MKFDRDAGYKRETIFKCAINHAIAELFSPSYPPGLSVLRDLNTAIYFPRTHVNKDDLIHKRGQSKCRLQLGEATSVI